MSYYFKVNKAILTYLLFSILQQALTSSPFQDLDPQEERSLGIIIGTSHDNLNMGKKSDNANNIATSTVQRPYELTIEEMLNYATSPVAEKDEKARNTLTLEPENSFKWTPDKELEDAFFLYRFGII